MESLSDCGRSFPENFFPFFLVEQSGMFTKSSGMNPFPFELAKSCAECGLFMKKVRNCDTFHANSAQYAPLFM
jgi:hypothetical protein